MGVEEKPPEFERNSPPASLMLKFRRTPTVFGVSECMYKFLAVVRMILEHLVRFWAGLSRRRRFPGGAAAKVQFGTPTFKDDEVIIPKF